MKFRKLLIGAILSAVAGVLWSADLPNRRSARYQAPVVKPVTDHAPTIKLLPRPAEAVPLALADLNTIDPFSRSFIRYLWVQDGSKTAMRVTSLACNYISRGSVIARPIPIANGHLLRVDLRWFAPLSADLAEWLKLWEEFAYDPTFALLITKDAANFAAKLTELVPVQEVIITPAVSTPARTESITIDHKGGPYTYPDDTHFVTPDMPAGKYEVTLRFDSKTTPAVKRRVAIDVDVFRANAPHLPQEQMLELHAITHSAAPIVEYRYFVTRSLSTIQDKGVFKQVFGGLYYQLRGIKKSTIKGASDLDLFFEQLGIGNIKAGLTQEKLFDNLRSDQRMVVFRSDITGKPREVTSFHTAADREGGSWGAITGDVKDEDVDIGDRAFANLLTPKRQAREAIFPGRTGFSIFGLFNDKGELQDEVPPDIAVDSTIPAPYTRRLQSAIGCIRCHGVDGSDGWKPLVNDVKTLMAGKLDIFGDLSQKRNAFTPEVIDRLAGLYAGDFSKNLRRARDDVAEVTLRATGPWSESVTQADAAKIAAVALSNAYADFNYAMVDPQKALHELGLDVPKAKSLEVINRVLAADARGQQIPGVYLEDPRIAALKAGISILRADWALAYAMAMERAQANIAKEAGK